MLGILLRIVSKIFQIYIFTGNIPDALNNHMAVPVNMIEMNVPKNAYNRIAPKFLKNAFFFKLYALFLDKRF